jgi:hypothetical protein
MKFLIRVPAAWNCRLAFTGRGSGCPQRGATTPGAGRGAGDSTRESQPFATAHLLSTRPSVSEVCECGFFEPLFGSGVLLRPQQLSPKTGPLKTQFLNFSKRLKMQPKAGCVFSLQEIDMWMPCVCDHLSGKPAERPKVGFRVSVVCAVVVRR